MKSRLIVVFVIKLALCARPCPAMPGARTVLFEMAPAEGSNKSARARLSVYREPLLRGGS